MPESTENGTKDKRIDGQNHQEAVEIRTPLEKPSSDEHHSRGVKMSTNYKLSENSSLPSQGSNLGFIGEMSQPQPPLDSIQTQS